jgi:SAM-dependent methyltransferase
MRRIYRVARAAASRILSALRISQVRATFPMQPIRPMITRRVPEQWSSIRAESDEFDAVYRAFGAMFRGPEELVQDRERPFVQYLERAVDQARDGLAVADIGCGRGEFLALLAEAGIPTVGVETSERAAAVLRQRGFEVTVTDANSYLSSRDDASLAGVVSFAVLEHMDPDYAFEFLRLVGRKVAPGGCALVQTSNPECFAETASFWLDITHVRPYHPYLTGFYLNQMGFHDMEIVYSLPAPWPIRLTASDTAGYLAYTIVGFKPTETANPDE